MVQHSPAAVYPKKRLDTWLYLIFVLAAVASGLVAYYAYILQPLKDQVSEQNDQILRLSGLNNPVKNVLDSQFTDADGDMLADAPTNPADCIDPPKLTFSYVGNQNAAEYRVAFADLIKAIQDATGKPVEYLDSSSSDEQLRQIKDGALHITALNTGKVPIAVCLTGFVPFASIGTDKGAGTYEMEILAASKSPIQSISDLQGHELALTEMNSNSGYKAPLVLIKDQGLLPGRDFGVRYSLGHDESIKGLADGSYEVVAVANDVLKRAIAHGVIKPEQYRSIYKSSSFPAAAFGYTYRLKPELAAKVRDAIFNFKWAGTSVEKFFAPANQTCFVKIDYKKDWALVRKIDDDIGVKYQLK